MADTEPSTRLTGGCQCGDVRYAVTAGPEQVTVCHCRMCQKATGGPFMSSARFAVEAVTWTHGAPAIFRSSSFATRGFCPACGTPLTYQYQPDHISVTTGSFDEPAKLIATDRCGVESLLPWSEHIASLPSEMTDDWLSPEAKASFVNNQHPDHDT